MSVLTKKKAAARERRKKSIRKKIFGTTACPRMSVFRSNKHIYVQVVDDSTGRTLASASTLSAEIKGELGELKKADAAKKVGELCAKRCSAAQIDRVVFDRNGYLYTGRIAAVAAGARAGGLSF
jgi:large subunit ribosomal protein L18